MSINIAGIELEQETKWEVVGGIPRRGITDYLKTIYSKIALSDADLSAIKEYLQENNCPGWTEIRIRKLGQENNLHKYSFATTMDSSD